MTNVRLTLRYSRSALNLTDCLNFKFTKNRLLPYTEVTGEWYCPKNVNYSEIISVILYIDNAVVHNGMPCGVSIKNQDGRAVLKVSSRSYSCQLMTNQCADGLITDVNLESLVSSSGIRISGITYQPDTPTVNYVNYYNGTSLWDGIVSYTVRAGGKYPYLSGYNLIRITPPENPEVHEISEDQLISRSFTSDFSRIISKITMKPIDGEGEGYTAVSSTAARKSIVRAQEIPFDREWIMDPEAGLKARIDYSEREENVDAFRFWGYVKCDLLERLSISGSGFSGDITGFTVEGRPDCGVVTEIRVSHDGYGN